jgi:hypothetical protein
MINRFDALLGELEAELGTPLYPDKIGACKLNVNEEFHVQLESDPHEENLLVATFICEIPPGKLRENILRDALKANFPFPQTGTLAYSDRNNQLTLFAYLPFAALTGRKLGEFLNLFLEKAKGWRTAVNTGQTSSLIPSAPNFGLPSDHG